MVSLHDPFTVVGGLQLANKKVTLNPFYNLPETNSKFVPENWPKPPQRGNFIFPTIYFHGLLMLVFGRIHGLYPQPKTPAG